MSRRLGAATDACLRTIELANEAACDLLLVHHGLFWGGSGPVVGPAYQRLAALFESGLGLYSSHLPLDTHDEVGNNVLLASALGLSPDGRFGSLLGIEGIGVMTGFGGTREELVKRVSTALGVEPRILPGGSGRIERLAIVSGGGGSMIAQAARSGADAFLTGEGNHHTYHEALELGIDVFYAGHYATETLGVQALARRTAGEFGLEWSFFDGL